MMRGSVANPVLGKELRSRMRTWKTPLVVSIYLGVMALITVAYYWGQQGQVMNAGFGPDVGPQIYVILAIFQLLLVAFVTPAFTAGVISGERERQTLDLLICTRLSPANIVLNKLLASVVFILLLLVASLPVFSVVYFFGGIRLSEIGQAFVVYLMTALTLGAIGVFCSTIFKRTQVSVVVTYIIVFFFLVGTIAIAAFMVNARMRTGSLEDFPIIAYLNPLVALVSTFPGQIGMGLPFPGLGMIFGQNPYGPGGSALPATSGLDLTPWQYNFIGDGIITVILLAATILLVTPVGRFSGLKRWWRRVRNKRAKA